MAINEYGESVRSSPRPELSPHEAVLHELSSQINRFFQYKQNHFVDGCAAVLQEIRQCVVQNGITEFADPFSEEHIVLQDFYDKADKFLSENTEPDQTIVEVPEEVRRQIRERMLRGEL